MKKNYFTFLVWAAVAIIMFSVSASKADNKEAAFHSKSAFHGFQVESAFGANTVNIGDFNADGFDDLAISADGENDGEGKVYIYFGGNNPDRKPDVVLSPPSGFDGFGYKMSSAGDFNGDGFADLLVVSKNFSSQNPAVIVYFGGPAWNTKPDVYLQNASGTPRFGDDVAGLGDVNGDGIDDIGVVSGTSVALYFGSLGMSATKNMDQALNHPANHIVYCGDVNGDGYNDILNAYTAGGSAFVYRGGPEIAGDPDLFFRRTDAGSDSFGFSLSAGGDINGDGLTDIIIGDMNGSSNYGEAFIYLGSPGIFDTKDTTIGYRADFTLTGPSLYSDFGSAVAIVSDMNGDGMDEFAVAGSNLNYMNLYYGGHQFSPVPSQVYKAGNGGYFFNITSLDFNGDGYYEIFAGNYEQDVVFTFNNEIKHVGSLEYDFDVIDRNPNIRGGGDFNGDGENDFFTYMVEYTNGAARLTNVKLYLGGSKFTGKAVYSWYCNMLQPFGEYQFVGDYDGDGLDDIVVNRVLIKGKRNISNTNRPDTSLVISNAYQMIENGDFNRDGYGDLVMKDTSNRIKIIYGGPVPETVPIRFSFKVGEALTLDLNGDGTDDLILYNRDQKELRIFFGKSSGFRSYSSGIEVDKYIYLTRIFDDFSQFYYLRLIGDVNDDGNDEFLVGYKNRSGTFVYMMAAYRAGTISWTEEPGFLAYVGDINRDGIADVRSGNGIYFGQKGFGSIAGKAPDMTVDVRPLLADINGDGYPEFYDHIYNNRFKFYFGSFVNMAPHIVSVKDVPYDQGGKVTLSWFKSGRDGEKVKAYQIERSIAPMTSGFAWEVIASVPATRLNYYSYTAPTLNDRMEGNPGNTYFRITALTDHNDVFYRSGIRFGHSTDNLAPAAVNNLKALPASNSVQVSWQPGSENDLKEYQIYRCTDKSPDFDTLKVYGMATDSLFVDHSPLDGPVYYFVRPVDIHQNVGEASSVLLDVTDVMDLPQNPRGFTLQQNTPNPFKKSTVIRFSLPQPSFVTLSVYNIRGEKVTELLHREMNAGTQSVVFDASHLPAGVYFCRIRAGNFVAKKKMLVIQ